MLAIAANRRIAVPCLISVEASLIAVALWRVLERACADLAARSPDRP